METQSILITGGGGFLGSHLAEHFLSKNKKVICVDNFSTGLRSNKEYLMARPSADRLLQFIEADVSLPWKSWAGSLDQISQVFHFASPASPPHYQRLSMETMWVNTLGLNEALQFADAHKARVIFSSTSEIYGDPERSPQPETYWGNVNTIGPRSCYDEAKRFGETLVYTHNQKFKTGHGMVRIFNTYGPRMNPNDGRVIINFLVQALKGEELSIYGSGKQSRSFCYVEDLISGIVKYANTNLTEPVNLGNENEFSILELAQTVQEIFNEQNTGQKKLVLKYFDLPKDDPRQRCPDLTKAKKLLSPWEPRIALKQGLLQMITWLRTQDLSKIEMAGRPL